MDTMTAPRRRRSDAPRGAARLTKAERRRQLLAHAKRLFLTQGYHATTTQQIADAVPMTEPELQRHFDSKKALFLGVLEEIRAATLERWEAETAGLSDPLAKLHAVTDMYLDSTRAQAAELRIMHRALVETDEPEIVAIVRSFYLDSEALLARIIAEGQQTGVFRRSLDPRIGAWELISTALGYTLTCPLGIPLFEEENYLPRAIECLLHCLLKTDV
jgi:AcrR family transcriptional regulator